MQHQHHAQRELSQPALLILASLAQGPKHAIALQEAIEQAEGLYIEPGTLYRVLAQLEQRGWIEALTIEQPLRLYQITAPGCLAFERAGAGRQGERQKVGGHPGLRKGKEIIMRLVLWILCLYPPTWRERYEAEMTALLEQHQITLWTVLNLLVGALDARLDPHYRRARQLLPLRRFQTSWQLVVVGLVAFWIALLPWFWMSVLGISSDTRCSNWGNNYALCMMRVTVGMHGSSMAQTLVGMILGFLPILLVAFTIILDLARGRRARTHLLLVLPVTTGMIVLCLSCGIWLRTLWPLLPQISHFYPQATAGLLAGLVGMGLATLLALGSLARAAFALRALSAASPKQESHPFSSNQQASEAAQGTDTPDLKPGQGQALPLPYTDQLASVVYGRGDPCGRPGGGEGTVTGQGQALPLPCTDQPASAVYSRGDPGGHLGSVPKGWVVLLVVLLLLFVLPWPLLLPSEGPDFLALLFTLVTWFLAGIVGLITTLLVKSPGKKQAERATEPLSVGAAPKVWAIFLLILLLASKLMHLGPAIFGDGLPQLFSLLLSIIAICIIPALVVKIRISNQQADRTTDPQRNAVSPKVWIIVAPVLFLVFCMQAEYIFLPDYPDIREVLIAWLLTGLASLIILLALKLGSRVSRAHPAQEALQQVQVQG